MGGILEKVVVWGGGGLAVTSFAKRFGTSVMYPGQLGNSGGICPRD